MCFTGDDGYQSFLVFPRMRNSLTLDNNKKLLTGFQLENCPGKLNDLILILTII